MRYGIISDIHSNLEAFEKVLDVLSKEKIDRYVCVGDIVGYGADPKACIEITKDLNPLVVVGNHDSACVGKTSLSYFNPRAKEAVIWTKDVLEPMYIAYLNTLDLVLEEEGAFTLVHGTLEDPESFNYMVDRFLAKQSFEKMHTQLLFVGHSHIPGIFELKNNKIRYFLKPKIKLSTGVSYIVNAGSVGQPRDGDNRACFVIYDTDKNTIEINRVEYDMDSAQKKILEKGLPSALAYRLTKGV